MGNRFGNAYGLTVLIPIKHGTENNRSYDKLVRDRLQKWSLLKQSPLALVPNTYLSRLFLLNDVFYEAYPAAEDHLASKYLVFSSNFHGELDDYLSGMWTAIGDDLKKFLQHCVAFDSVNSAAEFVAYIKRCQIKNSLFFNGSNDKPLDVQLKSLYVKQAFIHFAYLSQRFRYQGSDGAGKLQKAFKAFVDLIQIGDLESPTWPVATETVPAEIEPAVKAIVDTVAGAEK